MENDDVLVVIQTVQNVQPTYCQADLSLIPKQVVYYWYNRTYKL